MILLCLIVFISNALSTEIHQGVSFTDSPLQQVHWCDDITFIAVTDKGSVYLVSNDTWENLGETFSMKGLLQTEDINQVGTVYSMVPSPLQNQTLIFQGTKQIIWITKDCGNTITAVMPEYQLSNFKFHPVEVDQVLATAMIRCTPLDCSEYQSLMISSDSGVTWQLLQSYVKQAQWMPSKKHESRIVICMDPEGYGNQSFAGWSSDYNLYYSDDFLESKTLVLKQCAGFKLTEDYLFMVTYNLKNGSKFYTLGDENMIPIVLALPEHRYKYKVVDSQSDKIFLSVNRYDDEIAGTVYVSDESLNYTPSLKYLTNNHNFVRLPSIHQIFFANVYPEVQALHYLGAQEYYAQQGFLYKKEVESALRDLKQRVLTKLTNDAGLSWSPITIDQCGDNLDCSLHLYIYGTLEVPPIYMPISAPGLIIANGNIGRQLSLNVSELSTFVSIDAGQSWSILAKGVSIYEIFEHGDLILMSSYNTMTNKLQYTLNQGKLVQDIELEVSLKIKNIINHKTQFFVYGIGDDGNAITIKIDLKDLGIRKCLAESQPDQPISDYQYLKLPNNYSETCQNGFKTKYVIRKPNAQCLVKNQLEQVVLVTLCECSTNDYECDLEVYDPYCLVEEQNIWEGRKITYRKKKGNKCQQFSENNNFEFSGQELFVFMLLVLVIVYIVFMIKRNFLEEKLESTIRIEAQSQRAIFEDEGEDIIGTVE